MWVNLVKGNWIESTSVGLMLGTQASVANGGLKDRVREYIQSSRSDWGGKVGGRDCWPFRDARGRVESIRGGRICVGQVTPPE